MAEYRSLEREDADALRSIRRYAFAPEAGPVDEPASDDDWPPAVGDPRGLVADDELVSVATLYHLETTVRGEWTTIGGLGGVATPPEHRRRGYGKRLLRETLDEFCDDGVDLVALWPFDTPFYRSLGWGVANTYARYDVPPEQLSAIADGGSDAAGRRAAGDAERIRRLGADDWERLRRVEAARAERYDLTLRRSETWWRERTLTGWAGDAEPYSYGLERDGDLAGYVTYWFEDEDGGAADDVPPAGTVLEVQDLAAVDPTAERALYRFLGDHDSQAETVRIRRGDETALLQRVPDPDAVECDVVTGPMVRLVDVPRALAAVDWPRSVDADLELAVADPLVERNDGRFSIEIADGSATVECVGGHDDTASGRDPDVRTDVATLSQLVVGTYGVDRAERVADLSVRTDAAREALSASFPPRSVCLREFF